MTRNSKSASEDFGARIANIALKELEQDNKLPPGYLMSLRDIDSDWDFIVKLSLIVEALLTRAIVLESDSLQTYEVVSRAKQSDRIRSAKNLGLIDNAERKMLISLSEIRNAFVHRVENLTRSLAEYLSELEPKRQKQIAKSMLHTGIPKRLGMANDQSAIDQFPKRFRWTMLLALLPTLLKLGYSHGIKQREKAHADWRAEQERRLGHPLPPRTEFYLADRLMVMDLVEAKARGR